MTAEELAAKVSAARKYADIHPAAVLRTARALQGRYRSEREWEKAVRERLHGLTGAFVQGAEGLELDLRDDAALERALRQHASSRERLPLTRLDALYARLLGDVGAPESILDLACGLNPLYLKARWPRCRVLGLDVSRTCARLCGGLWADLMQPDALPRERFQIALCFKFLPLLEREREGAGAALLNEVNAGTVIASFPTRTLSGRNVGMARHYDEWLCAHLPPERAVTDKVETENEVYYILKENGACRD